MAPPDCIPVSEEVLTEWAMSCVHVNHLGTLIQRELLPHGEHARSIDLADQIARGARTFGSELHQQGARYSNAPIKAPRCIQIQDELAARWAEECIHIYKLGTSIERELPRTGGYARVIDLLGRVTRRALTIVDALIQHGAEPTVPWLDETM